MCEQCDAVDAVLKKVNDQMQDGKVDPAAAAELAKVVLVQAQGVLTETLADIELAEDKPAHEVARMLLRVHDTMQGLSASVSVNGRTLGRVGLFLVRQ